MPAGYREDLAFVHDQGFTGFTLDAAPRLAALFGKRKPSGISIVELGCGSGRLAAALSRKGFAVMGIDSSRAMIALAKRNAPRAKFRTGSLWTAPIPRCNAVFAVGEVLNYQFGGTNSTRSLRGLFSKVYRALAPSGMVVFDVLCEGPTRRTVRSRNFTQGKSWLVAVEKEDSPRSIVRRISTFRRVKGRYRRSFEVHAVRRYRADDVVAGLKGAGFLVTVRRGYGRKQSGSGLTIFIGKKPGGESRR